ncbi:amidase family protein [Actibacterium pelagium]|uniref:Amidase n=1 Tax=Actibacterium pelagium TaxID=2029103 RepID=A0A917ELX3_9RHOB|nr:amidase family protein [Actibacterium pelagium]GGE61491.1 amidase [Actibacterium pelagium]
MTKVLWRLSAVEISQRTQSGDLSVEDVTKSHIDRMNAINPQLNAVVEDLSEAALERACSLDAKRAAGADLGPLHGVPVTIKINVDQAGSATSNGVTAFKDMIAKQDAPLVANLLRAGAVVIGRTNTPEFSFRADTDNPLHGRTHNPWGPHASPGGSSGGAGAAVMAGIGALAHGNDIGGSLRFPAYATGAVTIKPGLHRVPAWNPSQKVERGALIQMMSVQGFIARSVDDLELGMLTAVQPGAGDPFHAPLPWRGTRPVAPIKVAFTKNTYEFDLDPEVSRALDAAKSALIDAGYEVEEVDLPLLRDCALDGYRALLTEVSKTIGPDIQSHGSSEIKEIFKEYDRQFPQMDDDEFSQTLAKRTHYARVWAEFMETYPLVLTPFLPHPIFSPNRDLEGAEGVRDVLGAALYSYSMNFLGLPAGVMSTHLSNRANALQPVGVQIVGQRWREDLVCDAMREIEKQVGRMSVPLWELLDKQDVEDRRHAPA